MSTTKPAPFLRRRVVIPVAVLAVLATGGVTAAVALAAGGGSGDFIVQAVSAPPVLPGGTVAQSVAGLWEGSQVTSWTKVDGPSWLSVSDEGTVTGTAPAAADASSVVTVEANGDSSSTIKVAVSVTSADQPQRLEAASWNLDDAGAHASFSAQEKELTAILGEGVQVIGVQESGGTAAKELAGDLGWYYWQAPTGTAGGDLGLISAYPISNVTAPTAGVPAVGATVDVNGQDVRVWNAHLDEADYGPTRACSGSTDLAVHESTTTRATQATALVAAMATDITASAGSTGAPVVLLGDLASPAASDWTAATSASHCNAGAVAWPVPATFITAGLADSYRTAFNDSAAHPGNTLSGTTAAGDRVDYVDYAGSVRIDGAESYSTSSGTWPSDHAAAITLFDLTAPHLATAPAQAETGTTATPSEHPSPAQSGSAGSSTGLSVGSLAVTGTPAVGSTLRAVTSAWPTGSTFGYQWFADGVPVAGAVHASYVPGAAQKGRQLSVRATGTQASKSGTVTVNGPVVRAGTLAHGKPRITGSAKVGRRLTAHAGAWSAAPRLSYQWYANGHAIKGATRASFKPGRAQHGKHLTVKVTATKPGYTSTTATSGATKTVR